MGKLNGMTRELEALAEKLGNRRVAEMFGVDPEVLEKPADYDPVEAREREHSEALCDAICSLEKALKAGTEAQVKAVSDKVIDFPQGLATDKGIEKSVKALAKVIETSLKERPDTGIPAVLDRMVALMEENQQLSSAIVKLMSKEESEPESFRFDIDRDRNGFMTSVIARPQ